VLIKNVATRQVVICASHEAQARGVCQGMTLAHAHAICPRLTHEEYQPQEDRKGLVRLARWMMRFTPIVALDGGSLGCTSGAEDEETIPALFLDVSGCDRVYRGLSRLMQQIDLSLRRLRLHATLAIAPTPGAAWALCLAGRHRAIISENLSQELSALSPNVLRIDPAAAEMLHHLGIKTIDQLMQLPRQSLPARFGTGLLTRLDQALGRIDEPLIPLLHEWPIEASIDFEGPIDALETIWNAFAEMLHQVIRQLMVRGSGARRMEMQFLRPYAPIITKTILLSRPSRDPKNLFNLIRCAIETLEETAKTKVKKGRSRLAHMASHDELTSDGFIGVRLRIPHFEKLAHEQVALLEHEEHASQIEFDRLVERLALRLGDDAVLRPRLLESHIPENAYACVSATGEGVPRTSKIEHSTLNVERVRPLRVYETPIEVPAIVSPSHDRDGRPISFTLDRQVHRLPIAIGPERICGEWWTGHHKTRDYFLVEDETGHRFWIFRVNETSRWYLHGEFE
jgi:protein ImuB